ncbi:high-affinity nickel-transport protein-domain-containing protein [Infundibulicybe gibba]|nr:high-affinity nickel-transport protein-domain-containing protein [Infundibulicybe gibba]
MLPLLKLIPYRLTLLGRCSLLVFSEILANAICWIVSGIIFGSNRNTRPILSLALLAWTLGLRHALDADHISAIDNATRGLISLGQLPVMCGLFFSLGHSTIVIIVTVAIAISSDVYKKINGVGTVGGIVGAAVSGSFLFIVGLANSVILWRIIKQRRQKNSIGGGPRGETPEQTGENPKHNHMLMMRLLGPIITFVNRPWKMYPVGVLFGFGFDTASSIALLAVSAIARKGSDGASIPSGNVVILPLLFTAGMTLIDSLDSVLMLYSYAGFPERSWALVERKYTLECSTRPPAEHNRDGEKDVPEKLSGQASEPTGTDISNPHQTDSAPRNISDDEREGKIVRDQRVKMHLMSGLSIILTSMSILVAFSISLITIMGLIGEQCGKCVAAAEAEDGGGLAGRWWRGWAKAGENSGYIGVAIVGGFMIVVSSWYGSRWFVRKLRGRGDAMTIDTTVAPPSRVMDI